MIDWLIDLLIDWLMTVTNLLRIRASFAVLKLLTDQQPAAPTSWLDSCYRWWLRERQAVVHDVRWCWRRSGSWDKLLSERKRWTSFLRSSRAQLASSNTSSRLLKRSCSARTTNGTAAVSSGDAAVIGTFLVFVVIIVIIIVVIVSHSFAIVGAKHHCSKSVGM